MRLKWLFLLSGGLGLAAFLIGVVYIRSDVAKLREMGVRSELILEARSAEVSRWLAVAVAVVLLGLFIGAVMSLPPRYGVLTLLMQTLLIMAATLFASGAAYWPDRALISRGVYVHPPRPAVYLPIVVGVVLVLVYRYRLRRNRGPNAAGA